VCVCIVAKEPGGMMWRPRDCVRKLWFVALYFAFSIHDFSGREGIRFFTGKETNNILAGQWVTLKRHFINYLAGPGNRGAHGFD